MNHPARVVSAASARPDVQRKLLDLRIRIEKLAKRLVAIAENQEAIDGSSHA